MSIIRLRKNDTMEIQMKYVIDEKLANAILNYLVNRPYLEVANLIQGLHTMVPHDTSIRDLRTGPVIPPPSQSDAAASPFVKLSKSTTPA